MTASSPSRRRRRKRIICEDDGSLYDVKERRRISNAELRSYLQDGGLFEARRRGSGADCTYEVLQGAMGRGVLEGLLPGLNLGSFSDKLGGLGALSRGLGALSSLSGEQGGLGGLGRLLEDGGRDEPRPRRESRDEPPRRRRANGRSEDWYDEPPRSGAARRPSDEWWNEPAPRSGHRQSSSGWGDSDDVD